MKDFRRRVRSFPLWVLVLGVPLALIGLAWVVRPVRREVLTWPSWHWFAGLEVPPYGWLFLLFLGATLVLTRTLVRRSPAGPILVGEIRDATGWQLQPQEAAGGPDPHPATAGTDSPLSHVVQALLRERIARAGQDPISIVPSHGGLDVATEEPVASAPEDGYGLLTRLGQSFWRSSTSHLGWRVTGTLRRSEDGSRYGLTVVLQHVATRRHAYTHTVWAHSPQAAARVAAYEVASWRQQKLTGASTRRAPDWRPSAQAMRNYEDATFYSSQRRLDEAIRSAQEGLAADPSNIVLRRVLGETYEQLGHFLSALHVYASGVVLLLDVGNGWSRTVHTGDETGHDLPGWPRGRLRRALSAEASGPLWRQAEGLLWRYVVVLLFADQWVDRWIADLERVETARRQAGPDAGLSPAVRFPSRTRRVEGHEEVNRLIELSNREIRTEDHERDEEAKRLRGFLHRRYHPLLRAEFPLLEASWFCELHERRSPFPAGGAAARPASAGLGAEELVAAEMRRIPVRRGRRPFARVTRRRERRRTGAGRVPRVQAALGGGGVEAGVEDVRALLLLLAEQEDILEPGVGPDERAAAAGVPDKVPGTLLELLVETHDRLGAPWGAANLHAVADALQDPQRWRALGLDRQLVAGVSSWAVHHLLRLDAAGGQDGGLARALTDPERVRLQLLRAQLDLRLCFFRAGLYELDHRRDLTAAGGLGHSFEVLQDLLWLTARFRYLDRVHQLLGMPERHHGHPGTAAGATGRAGASRDGDANGDGNGDGADEGRLAADDSWARLRLETTRRARRLTARRARLRGLWPASEEWSIWYYAACAHAVVMREPPGPGAADRAALSPRSTGGTGGTGGPAGPVTGSDELSLWKRRYDPFAEFAVRALNHAMLVRGRRGRTLIEAGAGDWMLYEDPDLENLRRHPRFVRWASATFLTAAGDPVADLENRQDFEKFREEVRRSEWRNEGTLGMDSRWGPSHVRWWLVNNHYLAQGLLRITPRIAARWRELGARLAQSTPAEYGLTHDFTERVAEDLAVWRRLANYRRFAARPDLRRDATTAVASLAGERRRGAAYPTPREVLAAPRRLDHSVVDPVLKGCLEAVERDEEQILEHLHAVTASAGGREPLVAYCERAASRWEQLAATVHSRR